LLTRRPADRAVLAEKLQRGDLIAFAALFQSLLQTAAAKQKKQSA